jgi:regulator of protease activity HflC (stomatin/prohibitin superfamily)
MRNLMFAAVLAMMTVTGCTCGQIEPGHVGVVVPLSGDEKGTLQTTSNGWYLYSFNTKVYEFPVYNQQHKWTAAVMEGRLSVGDRIYFGDKDGLRLGADVGIQFHVPPEKVTTLFKTYRQDLDKVRESVLKMSVQNALSLTAQDYKAAEIFGEKRGEFFQKALDKVRTEMSPNGLEVVNLYLNGDLELPEQIRNTIQATMNATMIAQQKENEKRAVEADAAKQVAQAEGEAKAAIARAEGEASAKIATAKGNADALVLEATAQATANQKLANSLTGSILELKKLEIAAEVQKSYAAKWQGGVPTTILPDQAGGYMMDMRGMQVQK